MGTTIRNNAIENWFSTINAKNVLIQQNVIDGESNIIKKENIWYQIKPPVASFIGREEELERTHNVLKSDNIIAVCGFGGIGKSELLRAYGYRFKDFYNLNVVWIDCETTSDFSTSFRGLATELNIPTKVLNNDRILIQVVTEIYRYMENNILFIFDNVKCLKDLFDYLPNPKENFPQVHILISSQNTEWGKIGTILLGVLPEKEAISLITTHLKDVLDLTHESDQIKTLVSTLQYLPLCLQQAAAYIVHKNTYVTKKYKITDYLCEFEQREDLLNIQFPDYNENMYDKTIWTTVQMMIDKIKITGNIHIIDALYLLSYLPSDNVTRDVFKPLFSEPNTNDIDECVSILSKYSAVTLQGEMISMHRLVQKVLRNLINLQMHHYQILTKALTITISLGDNHYIKSVLNHVISYPDIYLRFYEGSYNKVEILQLIAYNGFINILKTIIDTYKPDLAASTIGIFAATTGNVGMMKYLIEKGVNIHVKNRGATCLSVAANLESTDLAKYLIEQGANVNDIENYGYSPLAVAVKNLEMVKLLVEHGAEINYSTTIFPLQLAATYGKTDVVKYFLDQDAKLNQTRIYTWMNDLYLEGLISSLKADVVQLFLDYKICTVPKILFDQYVFLLHLSHNDKSSLDFFVENYYRPNRLLKIASYFGNDDLVRELLKKKDININYTGFEVCVPDSERIPTELLPDHVSNLMQCVDRAHTALLIAAESGHFETVKLLLESGADVNVIDANGFYPSELAFFNGHVEIGIYTSELEREKCSHTVSPTSKGNLKIVLFSLDNPSSNCICSDGYSVLIEAATNNNLEVANVLLKSKYNVKFVNENFENALHFACRNSNLAMVKRLVSFGVTVNHISNTGRKSPLELAVLGNSDDIVKYLVERGAIFDFDPDFKCFDSMWFAICKKNKSLVEYFVSKGARVSKVYQNKKTLSMHASVLGCLDILEYLIEIDPSLINSNVNGIGLAHRASRFGHLNILKYLESKNFPLDAEAENGDHSIQNACVGGHSEVVKYLVEEIGVNVNSSNNNQKTNLQFAARSGHLNIVKYLLDKGAHIQLPDLEANTALHDASTNGFLEIVKCLVEHGADFKLQNCRGETPVMLASKNKHRDVEIYLRALKFQSAQG